MNTISSELKNQPTSIALVERRTNAIQISPEGGGGFKSPRSTSFTPQKLIHNLGKVTFVYSPLRDFWVHGEGRFFIFDWDVVFDTFMARRMSVFGSGEVKGLEEVESWGGFPDSCVMTSLHLTQTSTGFQLPQSLL